MITSHSIVHVLLFLLMFLFIHCAPHSTKISDTLPPDQGKRIVGSNGMVVSAHPLASEVGLKVLQAGGNAVDAAVATAFALGVIEPMMGGLGGSGSMLIWNQQNARAEYLDFYARSPMNPDTSVLNYTYNDMSPLGAAVPGTVAGLMEAHERFGKLSREDIVQPAITIAEDGFPVHGLLSRIIEAESEKLNLYRRPAEIFFPGGNPLGPGDILRQPELAKTLRKIKQQGQDGFYKGEVASEMISVLQELGNPMTEEDLMIFEPKWKRPVCGVYRDHIVLSAPPPQSGFQIVQTLHLLDRYDLKSMGLPTRSYEPMHILATSMRITTADRNRFLGDPDYYPVPVSGIVSREYAESRLPELQTEIIPNIQNPGEPQSIDIQSFQNKCLPYDPYQNPNDDANLSMSAYSFTNIEYGDSNFRDETQTTHISVIDSEGNAVALTFTVGVYFGSGVWAAGSFLNSSQHIFSGDPGSPNALGPGRIPRSTTTPTIILSDGKVRIIAGAAGGDRIPTSVIQNIIYIIAYGMDPIDAIRMPRLFPFATSPVLHLEHGFSGDIQKRARSSGYQPVSRDPFSLYFGGVHLIEQRDGYYIGVADPRRDGEARGY
jgi:gamma-glutamyltranspeptidase / glutathione hydrolase